jgi:hypothetical protein
MEALCRKIDPGVSFSHWGRCTAVDADRASARLEDPLRIHSAIVGLVLAATLASPLHACTCGFESPMGQVPKPRTRPERAVVFVGHVLEVDHSTDTTTLATVRFVTESSWRGAMPDTVTLVVGRHAGCAHYIAGGRYLVFADQGQSTLVTEPCDEGVGINQPSADRLMGELGPPTWTAPPMGRRTIDARAVPIGAPILRRPGPNSVVFGLPSRQGIARFEIGDWSGTPAQDVSILYPEPGLYQFRITWTDGSTYESYLSIRCEQPVASELGRCSAYRFFGLLR